MVLDQDSGNLQIIIIFLSLCTVSLLNDTRFLWESLRISYIYFWQYALPRENSLPFVQGAQNLGIVWGATILWWSNSSQTSFINLECFHLYKSNETLIHCSYVYVLRALWSITQQQRFLQVYVLCSDDQFGSASIIATRAAWSLTPTCCHLAPCHSDSHHLHCNHGTKLDGIFSHSGLQKNGHHELFKDTDPDHQKASECFREGSYIHTLSLF